MNKKYEKAFKHLLIDTVNRNFDSEYMGKLLITMVKKYNIVINVNAIKNSFSEDNCSENYMTFDQFKIKYNGIVKNHFKGNQ